MRTRSGLLEIANGGALGEEFGIGEHLEAQPLAVRVEDARHCRRRPDRQRRLLDDNLAARRVRQDLARGLLPVLQVGGTSRALAEYLRRRVDGDEDDVGRPDAFSDVGGKKQVAAARPVNDLIQTRLIDRQRVAVPGLDTIGVLVGDGNLHVRAAVGNHGHRRAAYVAGADAENGGHAAMIAWIFCTTTSCRVGACSSARDAPCQSVKRRARAYTFVIRDSSIVDS